MMTNLPSGDWEILSAYLDGELEEQKKQRLQERLQSDANLRSAVETLQLSRTILRSQPKLRAPRNFTLTPEMAGIARRITSPAPGFSVMRLASVLATVFLVVISIGNLLANRMQPAQVPQLVYQDQPVIGMGGGGGGGSDLESSHSLAVPEEQAAPASDLAVETLAVETLPTETEGLRKAVAPTLAAQAPAQAFREVPPAEGDFQESSKSQVVAVPVVPFIAILQVILAVLAVVTGVIALYLHFSTR